MSIQILTIVELFSRNNKSYCDTTVSKPFLFIKMVSNWANFQNVNEPTTSFVLLTSKVAYFYNGFGSMVT